MSVVASLAKDPVNSVAIDDRRRRNFIEDVELLEGGGGWISRSMHEAIGIMSSRSVLCSGELKKRAALSATFSGPSRGSQNDYIYNITGTPSSEVEDAGRHRAQRF